MNIKEKDNLPNSEVFILEDGEPIKKNIENLFKNKNLPTSKDVAVYGYASMMKGKAVAIHKLSNYIMANSGRFVPRSWVVKIARMMMG